MDGCVLSMCEVNKIHPILFAVHCALLAEEK